MAKLNIVKDGDPLLHKKSRAVDTINERILTLLDDMAETMYKANGVGLAGPQIGVLRRIAVVDVGEGLLELINAEIVKSKGTQRDVEGCLSCPNEWGYVVRPNEVIVKGQDRTGKYFQLKLKEFFARAVCHELDHLDGKLFIDIADEMVDPNDLKD